MKSDKIHIVFGDFPDELNINFKRDSKLHGNISNYCINGPLKQRKLPFGKYLQNSDFVNTFVNFFINPLD